MSSFDSRGVSSVLGYILNFAIIIVLLTSLAALGVGFYDSTTGSAVEPELAAVGNNLAGEVQGVDRLARQSSSDGEVGNTVRIASQISGADYVIEIINQSYATSGAPSGSPISHADKCDRSCFVVESLDSDALVVINYVTLIDVESTRLPGGTVYVSRPDNSTLIRLSPANNP